MWGAIISFIFDLLGKFLGGSKTPAPPPTVEIEEKTDAKVEAAATAQQHVDDQRLRQPDAIRDPNAFSRD